MLWILTIACSEPEPDPTPPVDVPDPQPLPPPAFEAACVLTDNALRVSCTAELAAPAAVRVELERLDAGAPPRVFADPAVTASHAVLAWGLHAVTSYRWRVVDERTGDAVEGSVTTGALPLVFGDFVTTVVQPRDGAAVEAVLVAPSCPGGSLLMVDRDGLVIWYQLLEELDGAAWYVNAVAFTEDDTILVEMGKETVLELDLAGNVRMRADRGAEFESFVHHELFKRDGWIYAITSTTEWIDGAFWVIDGVYVFDQAGDKVDELSIRGLYPLSEELYMVGGYWSGELPGSVDFSHTNSVYVDDAGDVWLSFRHLFAFAKFRGGPGTPGFGELLWTVVGDPGSPIAGLSDYALIGEDPNFAGQHDVHPTGDGSILMFDNGFFGEDRARAVRFALDEDDRTLTEVASWELDEYCPIQGSVRELPGGDVLTTCPTSGTLREYSSTVDGYSWELRATCQNVFPAEFSRGIPIDLSSSPE